MFGADEDIDDDEVGEPAASLAGIAVLRAALRRALTLLDEREALIREVHGA